MPVSIKVIEEGLIESPLHYGIVLNVPGGVRLDTETLSFFVRRLPKGSFWTGVGIGGRGQLEALKASAALGGNFRVGFEDNV